jgi:hypothetical protein
MSRFGIDLGGTKIEGAVVDPARPDHALCRLGCRPRARGATSTCWARSCGWSACSSASPARSGPPASDSGRPGSSTPHRRPEELEHRLPQRPAAEGGPGKGARRRGADRERRELLCAGRGDVRRGPRPEGRRRAHPRDGLRRGDRGQRPGPRRPPRDRRGVGPQPHPRGAHALLLRAEGLRRDGDLRARRSSGTTGSARGRSLRMPEIVARAAAGERPPARRCGGCRPSSARRSPP